MGGKKMEAEEDMPCSAAASGKGVADSEDMGYEKASSSGNTARTVPFTKLFSFADSKDVLLMIVGTVGAIGNGMAMPIMTIIMGQTINSFGQNQGSNDLVHAISKVCLNYVYLAIGAGVASFLGEVIGRMSGDTVLIQAAMGEKVGKFLQLTATFIGGFTIAFIKGWMLALVMLSAIPLLIIAGSTMATIMSRMTASGQQAYADAGTLVEQTIGSIRTVASFTGEKQAVRGYNKFLEVAYKAGVKEGITSGIGIGVVMMIIFSSYALAVWYGGKLILHRGYSGGQVINVIIAVLTASMSLGQTAPPMSAFAAGKAAAYKMFETINRHPVIDASDPKGVKLDEILGNIELRDVHFCYPARPDEQIFNGFSLSIPSGTTVALVGHSGSGKSTVISLIERFYDPQSGEVLIDGINLKDFQLKWIRQQIGLVSQEPVLFASSIRDNIAYGKDKATDDEIKAATQLANAAKFIDKLPHGINTMVGEHGTQLSGGQKQRIAIARAILKNPRILLLDEATSALDAESERAVQEALDRIMMERTTVIVAHRLTTVRDADMIAVIEQGKIIEKGSHANLLEDSEGAYSQLIRLQEVKKQSEQEEAPEDSNGAEITSESFSQSIQRRSFLRSMSKESFRKSSNQLSYSLSFGVPTRFDVTDHNNLEALKDLPRKEENIPQVSLRRLAYLNKPELPVLLAGTIAACLNGTIMPIYGVLISKAIKTFFETKHELKIHTRFWALMFMTLGLATLVAYPIMSYLFAVAGSKLIQRIRSMCFEKVVHTEIGWFDDPDHSSGAIGARLSADAAIVRSLVGDVLAETVQNTATAVAALIIAFTASWQLAFIVVALLPLSLMNGFAQVKFMRGFSADAKAMYEEASQVANDAVGSIRTVASFCAEEKVMGLYRKKCEGPMKSGVKQGLISGVGLGMSSLFLYCFYAISFYAGAKLVAKGDATFADVFQVFFALTMASLSVANSGSGADSSKGKVAAASVFSIIDKKSLIDSSDESGTILDDLKGEIELVHVSFNYPSRPDVEIFRDINLTIHSGKTVALVGESGSGKSTVIALLQRFYDPYSGHITLDGIEINKLQLKWLRKQIGLVGQEPSLFNDTIRANIGYGKEGNASEAEIIAASKLANAHRFISGLQHGYDTMVGERGIQLSGGQKQRVAIARAIVKEPKILLLDEATSALDAESERVVQDALDRVMVNRTTIVVAHRLSTVKNADLIAVVKNGVIVEKVFAYYSSANCATAGTLSPRSGIAAETLFLVGRSSARLIQRGKQEKLWDPQWILGRKVKGFNNI
ncbi:ABC transporter B family member 11 [Linum perenne]